jgi:large subunit ribosomal protein L22
MMEGVAQHKYVRVSSRKLRRLSAPLMRKTVGEVEGILRFSPSRSATRLSKAVHSAASNLKNKMGPDSPAIEDLVVDSIRIDQGPVLKRIKPRAYGRADVIRRSTSHVIVVVKGEEDGKR